LAFEMMHLRCYRMHFTANRRSRWKLSTKSSVTYRECVPRF